MRALVLASIVAPVLLGAQTAVRTDDDGIPRVSATATKVAHLTPDRATVMAVIEGAAETAHEAASRADKKVQAVTDALKNAAARYEIAVAPVGAAPNLNYNGFPGQNATNPFVARYIVRVQLSRIEQIAPLTTTLLAAGASSVAPIAYDATNADVERRGKYSEAIAQARADAELIAASMGMKLGQLVDVTTGQVQPQNLFGGGFINYGRGFEIPNAATPDVIVSATVTVRYRLVR